MYRSKLPVYQISCFLQNLNNSSTFLRFPAGLPWTMDYFMMRHGSVLLTGVRIGSSWIPLRCGRLSRLPGKAAVLSDKQMHRSGQTKIQYLISWNSIFELIGCRPWSLLQTISCVASNSLLLLWYSSGYRTVYLWPSDVWTPKSIELSWTENTDWQTCLIQVCFAFFSRAICLFCIK